MNNLFIDIEKTSNSKESESNKNIFNTIKYTLIDKLVYNFTGFTLKEDDISSGIFSNTFFLKINPNVFLNTECSKYYFKILLKRKLKNIDNLNVVFSKAFHENDELKNCVFQIFSDLETIKISYIHADNNLRKKEGIYISRYIKENKIDLNKFKLLLVLDDILDYDPDKLIKFIDQYKFVDILRLPGISKTAYKKLVSSINHINDEYGTTIDIIQKRNIQDYNYYLVYSKIDRENFKSHYILNKKAGMLDVTDKDDDVLSVTYKSFRKNKEFITTMFHRMDLDIQDFSQNELGKLYLKY